MNPNLFIRFKGIDRDNDSAVDLAELGESLTGFDSLFKSFGEILRISDTLEIKATATEEGSIIVDLLVSLQSQANGVIPFDSIDDFLNFLKLTKLNSSPFDVYLFSVTHSAISEFICGVKAPSTLKKKIKDLGAKLNVPVWEAVVSTTSFDMERKRI